MDTVPGAEPAYYSYNLRPELVLLGLLMEKECHGYELHKRFAAGVPVPLYFARQLAPDSVPGMIEAQRNSVLDSLQRMQDRHQKPGKQDTAAKVFDIQTGR